MSVFGYVPAAGFMEITAGAARYSGVTPGSSAIGVNLPAHAPSTDISTIRDYDLMTGDVTVQGGTADVVMQRKIAVLRLGISGAYPWDGDYGCYFEKLGVWAASSAGVAKCSERYSGMSKWEKNDYSKSKTLESTLVFSPGFVYAINASL